MRTIARRTGKARRFPAVPCGPERFLKILEPLKEFMISCVDEGNYYNSDDLEVCLPDDWNEVEEIREIEPSYIQLLNKNKGVIGSLLGKAVAFGDWKDS